MKLIAISVLFVLATFSSTLAGPLLEQDMLVSSELNEGEDVMTRIGAVNQERDLDLFEGDIEISDDSPQNHLVKRNAQQSRKFLWREKKVPYTISEELVSMWYKPTILKAMEEFHTRSCIRFIPHTTESNWVEFVKEIGCWSSVGQKFWREGGQQLSLGSGCNNSITVMHELLHALGFWHEQSRPDRNQHVEILWENIEAGKEHNFRKYTHFTVDDQDKPYDFKSIMHYGNRFFSKNGQDTIRSIHQPNATLGQRIGFSELDIDEMNELYDCQSSSQSWSSWSSFTPCDSECNKKRERFCSSSSPVEDCPGVDSYGVQEESVVCGVDECNAPVDGHWGRWSSWNNCSSSCGPGTRSRTRVCDDPVPANGGSPCSGSDKEDYSCVYQSCGLGPNDCEFEVDDNRLCQWTQDTTDEVEWTRRQGPTPSYETGPAGDHTSGNGHYLYLEASNPTKPGQKARLISQSMPGSENPVCLILSYNMYGFSMGSLNVYINNSEGKNLVASKTGDQGKSWDTIRVDLTSTSSYQVIIEGVCGESFQSDVAIDDIILIPGSCNALPLRNLGCYNDNSRPLKTFYKSYRDDIDWFDMLKTVKQCAQEAKNKGYKVFGVEFYGECWSSPDAKEVYNKDGVSDNCWQGVGKHFAFQAYELV